MDPRFLISSLLRSVEDAGGSVNPDVAVRLDHALRSDGGEGYLLRFGDRLCFAERTVGESEYRCRIVPAADCRLTGKKRERFLSAARIEAGGEVFHCAWSWSENSDADRILACLPAAEAPAAEAPAAEPPADPTPGELFCAALMYAAGADGELPTEQEAMIRRLTPPEALAGGVAFYQARTPEEFAHAACGGLGREQLLSMLANQLEVAMCDGAFRRCERVFLEDLAGMLKLEAEFRRILEVVLLKNRYAELFGA